MICRPAIVGLAETGHGAERANLRIVAIGIVEVVDLNSMGCLQHPERDVLGDQRPQLPPVVRQAGDEREQLRILQHGRGTRGQLPHGNLEANIPMLELHVRGRQDPFQEQMPPRPTEFFNPSVVPDKGFPEDPTRRIGSRLHGRLGQNDWDRRSGRCRNENQAQDRPAQIGHDSGSELDRATCPKGHHH
jgi:hypothetical protein